MGQSSEERPPALKRADSPPTPVADLSEYSPSDHTTTSSATPTSQFAYAHSHGAKAERRGSDAITAPPPTAENSPSPTAHFVLVDSDVSPRSSIDSLGFSRSDIKRHYAPIWFFLLATVVSMVFNLPALVGIFFVTKGEMRRRMYAAGCLTGAFMQAFTVIAFYRFILQ